MSRILLGVSGGIAAYKALELVRLATAAGHAVRVVQTPTSRRFVGEASFAALTGAPVLASEFERDPARGAFPGDPLPTHEPLSHLQLVANADLYLIAPASANTIAKLAAGIADSLLTSCALAAACPVLVAPAMNDRMYAHPATQANLRTLGERGLRIVEPGVGRLASKGEEGVGRLAEPAQLLAACEDALATVGENANEQGSSTSRASWRGVKVLVTAGGTREPLDSVRFLGNRSSGRMGLALAQAAAARGADVTVIAANVSLAQPVGVRWLTVGSAAELQRACEQEFPACDVLLMAAAVADFAPSAPVGGKIKKTGRGHLELVLEPTPDVLAGLSATRRADQTVVGFAAEHGNGAVDHGRDKLAAKGLDAVVVNDISRADIGFDVDANEVTILAADPNGGAATRTHVPRAGKAQVADAVLDAVETLRRGR
ncbi:MAG TPA: bifunctional phosphopantothenoylcysteine decarboxylase/phosphopantothenate--cysteine ligase CoaBC [Solirubrobacteraceae bacterium]|nr:bifunctional phosphopantothenoylcysteine decarboxylase/phosphopantothenate--cysteine ligase CoaBC [Solirubrobacteraceae bacterium]